MKHRCKSDFYLSSGLFVAADTCLSIHADARQIVAARPPMFGCIRWRHEIMRRENIVCENQSRNRRGSFWVLQTCSFVDMKKGNCGKISDGRKRRKQKRIRTQATVIVDCCKRNERNPSGPIVSWESLTKNKSNGRRVVSLYEVRSTNSH